VAVALGNVNGAVRSADVGGDADPRRPSIAEPVVAEHVAWARARLAISMT